MCFFSRFNKYQFGDLFPGDLYTIEMWAVSKGDENSAVVRNYTFSDSTYPLEPTIVTEVTVTEHTIHFGWTNPVYFSASYLSNRPQDHLQPFATIKRSLSANLSNAVCPEKIFHALTLKTN